jgi:hypothetical protein
MRCTRNYGTAITAKVAEVARRKAKANLNVGDPIFQAHRQPGKHLPALRIFASSAVTAVPQVSVGEIKEH